MSDTDDLDDQDDQDDEDDELDGIEDDESTFDRTRADYTGVELDDELQPVDAVELAEEGLQLDDPERLESEVDAIGSGGVLRRGALDPDDVGWELDADE